jgi:hypothetical protein
MLLLLLLLSLSAAGVGSCLLQYTWPEFVGADLSKVCLMNALCTTSWDQASSSRSQQESRKTAVVLQEMNSSRTAVMVGSTAVMVERTAAGQR